MSDTQDQKLRELAERMVAMSPPPPPFPEEITVSSPKHRASRLRPGFAFAGAAALVLVVGAVAFVIGFGGGPDPIATPTTVVPTTMPTPTTLPPTTAPSVTFGTTVPVAAEMETMVFLVTDPAASLGGNPALVPFQTSVLLPEGADTQALVLATLQMLGQPDQTMEPPQGFYNAVPQGVEFYAVGSGGSGSDLVITVEVSENFVNGAGGLLADFTMLNQIVYTVTWPTPDARVVFTSGGEVIEVFGSEGLLIDGGVTRSDFVDQLNSIVITEPFILGSDGLPVVAGIANTFEATVSLRIVWAESGEVVYEDFTTATCGTGCWGRFDFTLDVPGLEPGQLVQVFWDSPEDGSMVDVVTYPVGADGAVWDFFPETG